MCIEICRSDYNVYIVQINKNICITLLVETKSTKLFQWHNIVTRILKQLRGKSLQMQLPA